MPTDPSTIRRLQAWLGSRPDDHRATIQASITPGKWLAKLEVGQMGRGTPTWYGKGPNVEDAFKGALDAMEREAADAR